MPERGVAIGAGEHPRVKLGEGVGADADPDVIGPATNDRVESVEERRHRLAAPFLPHLAQSLP
jgi:hypothetical protein